MIAPTAAVPPATFAVFSPRESLTRDTVCVFTSTSRPSTRIDCRSSVSSDRPVSLPDSFESTSFTTTSVPRVNHRLAVDHHGLIDARREGLAHARGFGIHALDHADDDVRAGRQFHRARGPLRRPRRGGGGFSSGRITFSGRSLRRNTGRLSASAGGRRGLAAELDAVDLADIQRSNLVADFHSDLARGSAEVSPFDHAAVLQPDGVGETRRDQ